MAPKLSNFKQLPIYRPSENVEVEVDVFSNSLLIKKLSHQHRNIRNRGSL
jgi:hypothetical protein